MFLYVKKYFSVKDDGWNFNNLIVFYLIRWFVFDFFFNNVYYNSIYIFFSEDIIDDDLVF